LKSSPGQAIITIKTGKNSIDNICPPLRGMAKNKKKFFSLKGRKAERKRGCAEGCGNVVNLKGFPSFPCPGARGKRGGDFLFKPP
jgi:hypothetical protein